MGLLLRVLGVCTCSWGMCKHLGARGSESQKGDNSACLLKPQLVFGNGNHSLIPFMNGETEAWSFALNCSMLTPEGPQSHQFLAQLLQSRVLKWSEEQNLLNLTSCTHWTVA